MDSLEGVKIRNWVSRELDFTLRIVRAGSESVRVPSTYQVLYATFLELLPPRQ